MSIDWVCKDCGHHELADDRPAPKWDDGHICVMFSIEEIKTEIVTALARLATAREQADLAKSQVDILLESEAIKTAKADSSHAKGMRDGYAELVKILTLQIYNAIEEKKPSKGVEVKLWTEFEIDWAKIQDWVKTNMPALLVIDQAAFKNYLKSAKTMPPGVKKLSIPKVSLAKDLSEYIIAPDDDEPPF